MKLAALALAAALTATPALACSWVNGPEPIGSASAAYIAGRMAPAATYIDIAVAERVVNPTANPPKVEFRVVERIKGASPDRFTLGAAGLLEPKEFTGVQPLMHFVDQASGVVYPLSTPWELRAEMMTGTSCDPGFIMPVQGRSYVIVRDAKGRLLGPVSFAPGMPPQHGFAFADAEHSPDQPNWWLIQLRAAAAR